MNYSSFITPVLSVALLLGAAAPALAEEGQLGNDVQINPNGPHEGEARMRLNADMMASGTERMHDHEEHASSTEARQEHRDEMKQERQDKRIEKGQEKGAEAIDKRIKSLTELSARLANMKMLPAEALASIQASLAAEIAKLTDLKTKIGSDTATTTLKGDLGDITKANRVYLVVEPKARIAAAASRINAVVTQMQALATKLQTRITEAQTAGTDVTAATAALADLNLKIADAKVQADAAVALTVNLTADNGDATIKASNLAALKDARAKIDLAQKDLAAARHDAGTIYGVVKGKGSAETPKP
jgi:hypothetical protein